MSKMVAMPGDHVFKMDKVDLANILIDAGTEHNGAKLEELYKSALSQMDAELDEHPENTDEDGLYSQEHYKTLLADRRELAKLSDIAIERLRRESDIAALRKYYALFTDFLYACMTDLMGFTCTDMQIDIGRYIANETKMRIMIQAQRSEAKSTIAAIFAVWKLIHNCKTRVLIISAGSDVATEIANWIIQIIMNWDILECMRPDRQHGDRASTKAFDIHWMLKGVEKSPSVACIGITSNMQGRRADLLLADDIESSKNGNTETQRIALEHLSRDFPSICQKGRIVYLGTPQSIDSIYNNLEERGFELRIWPGRFPTIEEEAFYGTRLAPFIASQMRAMPHLRIGGGLIGNRGAPTDPVLLNESILCDKERDQGAAYFNLQHMLNTELTDVNRYPLNCRDLIIDSFGTEQGRGEYVWGPEPILEVQYKGRFISKPSFFRPATRSNKLYDFEGKHLYLDTAGGGENGDLMVAVVTYYLHGYIYLAEIRKFAGGFHPQTLLDLAELSLKHRVNIFEAEKNFGYGAHMEMLKPIIREVYEKVGEERLPKMEEWWESTMKEKRIIDTLEPVMQQHKLVVNESVIQYDIDSTKEYPLDVRESHKLFHQMERMCIQKGALIHDDAADALAGGVRFWSNKLAVNSSTRMEEKESEENIAWFAKHGGDIGQQKSYRNTRFQKGAVSRYKPTRGRR